MTSDNKAERLAAALRENLKRRKAQARGRMRPDRPATAALPASQERGGPDQDTDNKD